MNADYWFYAFSVKPFDKADTTYGLNDWTFNPVDGWIYVSKQAGNNDNALDNLIFWRKLDCTDYQYIPLKTSNVASGTLEVASLEQNVTCNTSFSGLVLNICKSSQSSVQTLALSDITGQFDFFCNPNGYGAVNPYKGGQGNFSVLVNTDSSGNVTYFYPRAYSYLGAYIWYFDGSNGSLKDGYYQLVQFLTAVNGDAPYYNQNVIVFDNTTNQFYVSLINNNTDAVTVTTSWQSVNSYQQFIISPNGQPSIVNSVQTSDFIQTANGEKLLYDLMQGYKSSCPCGFNSTCGDDLICRYNKIAALIKAADTALCLQRFDQAQCFLEKIPKNCAPYVSVLKC